MNRPDGPDHASSLRHAERSDDKASTGTNHN